MLKTQNIDTMTFCLGTRGARISELTNESLLLMTNKKIKQSWSRDFLDSPELKFCVETQKPQNKNINKHSKNPIDNSELSDSVEYVGVTLEVDNLRLTNIPHPHI